jgi:hypothetical protein
MCELFRGNVVLIEPTKYFCGDCTFEKIEVQTQLYLKDKRTTKQTAVCQINKKPLELFPYGQKSRSFQTK